jgi:hypothetical protein
VLLDLYLELLFAAAQILFHTTLLRAAYLVLHRCRVAKDIARMLLAKMVGFSSPAVSKVWMAKAMWITCVEKCGIRGITLIHAFDTQYASWTTLLGRRQPKS